MAAERCALPESDIASDAHTSSRGEAFTSLARTKLADHSAEIDVAQQGEAAPIYAREILLSMRAVKGTQEAPSSIGLTTRHVTPPRSRDFTQQPQPRIIPPPCSQSDSSLQELPYEAYLTPPLRPSTAELDLTPPGLTFAEEPLSPELEKEIEAAAASAWRAMFAAEVAFAAPATLHEASACSWGRDGDFSQLLSRLRRAPGGFVSLAVLRQEAPPGLRRSMRDGTAFATWLRHRTGAIEVCGSAGQEVVMLSALQSTNKISAEATEFCLPSGSFSFDPTAVEFYPTGNDSGALDGSHESEHLGVLEDDCQLPAAVAEACLDSSETMTVAEAHKLLFSARMSDDVAPRPPPGLGPEEEGELSVWPTEEVPIWQHFDESPVWSFDDLAWQSSEALLVPEADDVEQSSTTGKLNPKAAEFCPAISLAEYGQARMLGSARRRAARTRERCKASGVPDAIPEEPFTCSEETTSDAVHQANGSETATSNDEEESLPTVAAVTA